MNSYKKYDVVLVDFGDNAIGSEQGGKRPVVIVQNDIGNQYSTTTLVMPFTSKIKNVNQPTHSLFRASNNGLKVDSMLLGECLRQVSYQRVITHLGRITDAHERSEIKRVYNANFGTDGE